ncbi:hypothetical protein B7P43_G05722 [Cryptotermes secundus]|uniref:Mos1 transposase HTH domain-containing protein n=1 Tax=Cryptotermes secundus TaxID=105785 RepID=A0A2J7QU06_9NEOP|nr:hypothetical protein B7P43_G05722 [Cryptotermes secundus]
MLKRAFVENSLGQTQTYNWYKRFKNGRTLPDDDDHSGQLSTGKTPENVTKARDLILQDRRLTIQDFCNTLGLSYGTCQRILSEELNMRRIAAKFVPRLLQNEQKQHRLEVCRELQQQLQEDPNFLSKVVTVVPHPPYSPDLAPCNFFLFPKMKIKLKGQRFDTVEEIQAETQTVLNTLTKKDFQDAFEKWQKCWDPCMRSQGDCVQGDGAE